MVQLITSFESGLDSFSGSKGSPGWETQTSSATDGDTAARGVTDDSDGETIASTSGLAAYPDAGDRFRVDFQLGAADGSESLWILYACQSETAGTNTRPDSYRLLISASTASLTAIGGGGEFASTSDVSLSADTYYTAEIAWDTPETGSGEHIVTITDGSGTEVAQFSGTDTTYTSGGIGAEAQSTDGSTTNAYDLDHLRLPSPPAPATASQTVVDDEEIEVSWDGVAEADDYQLQVSEDGGGFTTVATPTATSVTYTAAASTNTHEFRVRARANQTESEWTATETVATDPSSLVVTDESSSEIDLAWDGARDADEYAVYRGETSGATVGDYTEIATTTATTYTDASIDSTDGESYFYRVQARYSGGVDSALSNEAEGTTPLPAPSIDSLDDSTQREITVTYSLNDNATDGDVLIERSTDGGATWSAVATITDLSATEWTDTGLDDGTEYSYRVTRRTDHAEATSGTATATTIAPEPVLDTAVIDEAAGDVIDITGTDTGNSELRHVIEVLRVDLVGDSWTETGEEIPAQAGDGNEITGSTAALLDGERYRVRLRTEYPDATTTSNRIARTTDLPDEDQPQLGNGVEDEIAVDRESAVSDYGDVRIQVRETGEEAWDDTAVGWAEQVLAYDTLTTTITNREDGEEYEIRARTETEHVDGAWTDAVSIVTKFPGATNLQATAQGRTEVLLEWIDNADNEIGQEVQRREVLADGSVTDWQPIDDAGVDAESYTDDGVLPGTTYDYRIRPYTDDTSALSNVDQATTDTARVQTAPVPATGPYVEVDHPDGRTLTPTVLDDEWTPQVNQRPTVSITVPQRDGWEDLEGEPMRVWLDGHQLPIDTLEGVTDTVGGETATTTLEATGAQALDEYTDDIQIDQQETHLAARDIIDEYTPYERNVDDPATDKRADVLMLAVSGASIADELLDPPTATDPVDVNQIDGAIQEQTGWFREVEDTDFTGTQRFADADGNDGAWSGNRCVALSDPGDGFTVDISVDHEIPPGEFEVRFLDAVVDGNPAYEVRLDGDVVDTVGADTLGTDADRFDLDWGVGFELNSSSTISPGIYSVTLECTAAGSGTIYADVAHVRDDRESYTFDDTPVDGVVQGPEQYPAETDVVLDDIASIEQVVAGELEVAMSSTAGSQAVAISNDEGETWIETANSETVSGEFASASNQIRARVTLSRYASDPTTSPAQGDAGQSVDDLEVRASLEDTPVTFDASYRDRLGRVLADLAQDGRMVWEVRRDPDAPADDPEGYIIEWTQIGQRTRASTQPVTRLERRTTLETAYDRVVVFGRSTRATDVEWSVDAVGTLVGLGDSWVVPGSERIYDPDTGEVFERGDDYRIEWDIGGIEILPNSQLETGATYAADYDWRFRGEATTAGVDASEARTTEQAIPGATSGRECDQLALSVLKDVQEAQVEAEITLLESRPDVPLVEALSHPRLPPGPQEVRGVDDGAGDERRYRLANRRTVEEIIADVREDIDNLADVV
ncbi:hypothetical protein Hbl1158_10200 [Halobaculum sp. CBA1158]|uniref:hypothetical protein n=1 Tax=Halobaculum sp. CBA1158 TaxID=2904243 RepID=UPI001F3EA03C|nr:hypothetical protein [Halobaculum sp. CBA1158]UIO98905.1 hypothetical protein Hbl1158_10200 [Halobaculum sp. CBA1158]